MPIYPVHIYHLTSRNHSAIQGLAPAIHRGALHQGSKQAALLLLLLLSFSYRRPAPVGRGNGCRGCGVVWRRVSSISCAACCLNKMGAAVNE